MKRFTLSFSHGESGRAGLLLGRHSAPYRTVVALLLAATGALLAFVVWQGVALHHETEAVRAALSSFQRSPKPGRSVDPTLTLSAAQIAAWNQLTRQLNTPWSDLLNALEQATPENVALVSIEPDARLGVIRLQAEAKTLDVLLTYVGALRAVPSFDSVLLAKHETTEQDLSRPVRLSMDVRFRARESR